MCRLLTTPERQTLRTAKENEQPEGARSLPKRSVAERRAGEATEAAQTGHNDDRRATAHARARAPKAQPLGARRSAATERPSETSGSEASPPTTNMPHGCRVAVWAGGDRKRGRRGNEGTRRPTAPRDDGAHGWLTAPSDRGGGKPDGAPRNEEGRETREPRDPEGVASGSLSVPSCPRRVDNLTFVNCGLSNCKTVTYIYLDMEI